MGQQGIVVFANERVGLEATRQIIAKYPISAIFTSHPSRKERIADYIDFSTLRREYPAIPLHFIRTPRDPLVTEKIREYDPALIVVVSWSQIIPGEILDIPARGTVGVHYSLLPARRGGAPFTWALIDGLTKTGLTLFYYDQGTDTGDIIDQIDIEIDREDNIKTLLDKTIIQLPKLMLRNMDAILAGTCQRKKQDESKASVFPARTPLDGEIDWDKSETELHNFIRAQTTPYPCAFSKIIDKNGKIKKLIIPESFFDNDKLIIQGYVVDHE